MNSHSPRRMKSTVRFLLFLILAAPGGAVLPVPAQEPPSQEDAAATNAVPAEPLDPSGDSTATVQAGERVSVGGGLRIEEGETVGEAVSVFGPSRVAGQVGREMVTVFGNAEMTGRVGREMVTVFGRSKMTGRVGREMVTVFGDAEVDGPVGRECVTVFGDLTLGPNADIGRECVAVFGTVKRHPDAVLAQEPISVLPMLSGLGTWITDGLMLGRLIPPKSQFAWIIVGLHFVFYGLIALLLPRPVRTCVEQLESRPFLSFGVGLLTLILLAPLYLLLVAIGVGVVLIPFIGLAELALVCLGKTATLEVFGFQLFRGFGRRAESPPLLVFGVGFILLTLLYMVPVVGILLWLILRPVALGAAVLACSAALRKNGNGTAPGVPVLNAARPGPPAATRDPQSAMHAAPPAGDTPPPEAAPPQPPPLAAASPLAVAVMPRAGFWIRAAATGVDFLALCWILLLPHMDSIFFWSRHVDSFFFLLWMGYHVGMWAWKGTTLGGIVFNLKVVRLDGRDADLSVCLVRGLASVISALPLLLGFFWVGWTSERQSWHDKIAGTVIVRVPKGTSLI